MRASRFIAGAATLAAILTGGVFFAPSASAETGTVCSYSNVSCMILWYNSDFGGSHTTFDYTSVYDFAGYTFLASGAGQGQYVKNNAASASYDDTSSTYPYGVIYYNHGFSGPCDEMSDGGPQAYPKLVNTYNNDASYASFSYYTSGCYYFG